jgi:hypothetical protein
MHAYDALDVAQACRRLRKGRPVRIGRLLLRPDVDHDMIWLRDPNGEVEIAATAIDEAGCLAALQGAVRWCIDGPFVTSPRLAPTSARGSRPATW